MIKWWVGGGREELKKRMDVEITDVGKGRRGETTRGREKAKQK